MPIAQPADRLVLRAGDEADCRAIEKDREAVMPSAPAILRDAPNVLGASEWRAIDDQYSPGQAAVEHKKNRLGSGRMSESGCYVRPGTVRAHPLQKSRHILYTFSFPVILPVCRSIRPRTVL